MSTEQLLHVDGVAIDDLIAWRDSLDDTIAQRIAAPTVEPVTVRVPRNKKVKVKVKRSKGGRLKRITYKTRRATKKGGRKVRRASRGIWNSSVRGVKRAGRWTANVGRKMWARILGLGGMAWSGLGWVGRKLAGAGAWVFRNGGKLVGWMLGGIGWGWALVAIGGLLVITMVTWAVGTSRRATVDRLVWVSKGRPGSAKKFVAKRKAKRSKKSKAKLAKAQERYYSSLSIKELERRDKVIQKYVAKHHALLEKRKAQVAARKAAKKLRRDTMMVEARLQQAQAEVALAEAETERVQTVEEIDQMVHPDPKTQEAWAASRALTLRVLAANYDGLTLNEIAEGLFFKLEELEAQHAPKDVYGFYLGRWYAAHVYDLGTEEFSDLGKNREKLYMAAKQRHLAEHRLSNTAASKKISWTKFKEGFFDQLDHLDHLELTDEIDETPVVDEISEAVEAVTEAALS